MRGFENRNKNFRDFLFFSLLHFWMEQQHLFAFSFIIEGTAEKVLQFIMPLKSIYNKNLGFVEQKRYFWTLQRGSNKYKSINWHYFCHEKKFPMTSSELPPIALLDDYLSNFLLSSFVSFIFLFYKRVSSLLPPLSLTPYVTFCYIYFSLYSYISRFSILLLLHLLLSLGFCFFFHLASTLFLLIL